jgi:uncharacterized membrane protein
MSNGEKEEKKVIVEDAQAVEEGKSLAWLSYFGLLLLIPLLVKPDNSFCKHHAKQGLVMLLFWIGISIISIIPILGYIIWVLGAIVLLVLSIIGIVNSLQGKYWKAPLGIYDLSKKFTF